MLGVYVLLLYQVCKLTHGALTAIGGQNEIGRGQNIRVCVCYNGTAPDESEALSIIDVVTKIHDVFRIDVTVRQPLRKECSFVFGPVHARQIEFVAASLYDLIFLR